MLESVWAALEQGPRNESEGGESAFRGKKLALLLSRRCWQRQSEDFDEECGWLASSLAVVVKKTKLSLRSNPFRTAPHHAPDDSDPSILLPRSALLPACRSQFKGKGEIGKRMKRHERARPQTPRKTRGLDDDGSRRKTSRKPLSN